MKDVSIKDVFISYRRDGGAMMAHHLNHWLTTDGYSVFLDAQLGSGRFDKALYKRIEECTDFLLVVSPNGFNRCNDPTDWVRLEIEHALRNDKNIIPVIMPDCEIPKELPESINEIQNCQGIEINLKLEKAVFELLEQNFMQSKPHASIAELDFSKLENPVQHSQEKVMSLHEQMSQKALRDTANNAENHITAIQAAQGDADAQFRLADCYHSLYTSSGIIGKEMIYWLNLAVAQNHPKAMHCLGKCYYHGYGIAQHPAKAVIYFRKSLEHDEKFADAMCSLGDCYLNGVGVTPSVVQALALYKQAMETGHSSATGKYINLIRTEEAVKNLNVARVFRKIKSILQKKAKWKDIDYAKAFRLLAVRMLGFIRYGSLLRFHLLPDHEHTIDQIGEDHLQKYHTSSDRWKDFNSISLLVMAFIVFGIGYLKSAEMLMMDYSEDIASIRQFFSEMDISNTLREFLTPTVEWLVSSMTSPISAFIYFGVSFVIAVVCIEAYKNPELEYWNLPKMLLKPLVIYAGYLLLLHLMNSSIAFLALILYLILPHKHYSS